MADPRVFFAAERTLLAWVRTGIAVIALGFVVARFGLFLRVLSHEIAPSTPTGRPGIATVIGLLLTLLGSAAIAVAVVQYRAFISTLPAQDMPTRHRPSFTVTFGLAIASCGVVLAIYLVQ